MDIRSMHYAENGSKAFDRRAVCGEGPCARITTAMQIVTCIDCLVWIRKKAEEEMPKDAKTTAEDLRRTANELLARAAEIEREEKAKAIPEEPRLAMGNTFKLIVWFKGGKHTYTYLLVRKPQRGGPWFTTGTGDTGYFENWEALIAWLRSDNIVNHSALIRMEEAKKVSLHDPNIRYSLGGKQR